MDQPVYHSRLIREVSNSLFESFRSKAKAPKNYATLRKQVQNAANIDLGEAPAETGSQKKPVSITPTIINRLIQSAYQVLGNDAPAVLGKTIEDCFDRKSDWSGCREEELKRRLTYLARPPYYRLTEKEAALSNLCGWWLETSDESSMPRFSVGLLYEYSEGYGYLGTAYERDGSRGFWHSTAATLDSSPGEPLFFYRYKTSNQSGETGKGFGEILLRWCPVTGRLLPREESSFVDVRISSTAEAIQLNYRSVSMRRLDEELTRLGAPCNQPGYWPSIDESIQTLMKRT